MLNLVREGEEDYIEAIRYRRRLKIFENFLLAQVCQSEFDFQKDLSMKITSETKERSCNNSPHAESKHFISKKLMHAMRAYVFVLGGKFPGVGMKEESKCPTPGIWSHTFWTRNT